MDVTATTMSSTDGYYTVAATAASTASAAAAGMTRGLQRAPSAVTNGLTESNSSFVSERFGLFIFIVACSISLVIILSMVVREYYWRKYGVDVCPGTGPRGRAANVSNQIMSDQAMAMELQRQINEEIREQERLEKRKERRAWYESYIKPYTMVSSFQSFSVVRSVFRQNDTSGWEQLYSLTLWMLAKGLFLFRLMKFQAILIIIF